MFNWEIWMSDSEKCEADFERYLESGLIKEESEVENLSASHILKVDHNLEFVGSILEGGKFPDWAIVGCYYSIYHTALALLVRKGFSSKNHQATLCGLIHLYFESNELEKKDIELIAKSSIEKEEISYFVEAKDKRETSSYGVDEDFTKGEALDLREKTLLFVNKVRGILE